MKKTTKWALLYLFVIGVGVSGLTLSGDLEPPGPPAPTMVTLQEIFDQMKSLPPDTCFDNTGNRFVDCGNGTVKDTETGLFWLKAADCFVGNWANANIKAAELADGQCSLTDGSRPGDWRLTTSGCPVGDSCSFAEATGELASILADSCPPPFVLNAAGTGCWSEGDPFSGVLSGYWSSATVTSSTNTGWAANLFSGFIGPIPKTGVIGVWPVRGGP